jgi:deoxycytidylate deaminase
VVDNDGAVLGQGYNDVPKSGGGGYWCDDTSDGRDYSVGEDYSVRFRRQIVEEVVLGLAEHEVLSTRWREGPDELIEYLYAGQGREIWQHYLVANLLEFGRPMHAEMSAILDAQRKGLSVIGATLYCTTFPCHLCARLIIGAGIARVVYIEPYPKSKSQLLNRAPNTRRIKQPRNGLWDDESNCAHDRVFSECCAVSTAARV